MTVYAATGWEAGDGRIVGIDADRSRIAIESGAGNVHTGSYALRIATIAEGYQRVQMTGTPSDVEVNLWVDPHNAYSYTDGCRIRCVLTDGNIIEIRLDVSHWDAYVDGVEVATGSVDVDNEYHNVAVRFHIDNSGHITTRIDGIDDISYSGDTQPDATSDIDYVEIYAANNRDVYIDDMIVQDYSAALSPALQFDGLTLDSDDTAQWDRSAGAANYEAVDEIPADETDYVYTGTDAEDDLYGHSGWDGTDKTPQIVALHHLAQKTDAVGDQIYQLLESGATTDVSAAKDLLTDWKYLHEYYTVDPNTSAAWLEANIDAALFGQRSNIT